MAHKKCLPNQDCGCKDTALNTPPPCPAGVDCPEPTTCSEIWDAKCIIYNGDPIVELNINPGDSFNSIMEKLILLSTNPGCMDFTADCQSALNLHSTAITSSSIAVTWDNTATATTYYVEYKLASDLVWSVTPAIIAPNHDYTLTGLAPASDYHIRISAVNETASPTCSCYSLTIKITTLSAS